MSLLLKAILLFSMININISNPGGLVNDTFKPLLYNNSRHLLCKGGAGSGKSYFATTKVMLRTLDGITRGVPHKFLVLRKVRKDVKRSCFTLFGKYRRQWGLEGVVREYKGDDLKHVYPNGSEIIFDGLDDAERINSIEGITGVYLEEAQQFTKDDLEVINLRLRGETPSYKQIIYTFNPTTKQCGVYKKFYKTSKPDNALYHTSTFRDNKWLDGEYRKELEAYEEMDEWYYKVYNLGHWGVKEGLIITNYNIVTDVNWPKDEDFDDVVYGLDFGYNNPSALVKVAWRDDELYVQELIYETRLTNTQLIDRIKEAIPERHRGRIIYADTAEPDRIEEINEADLFCLPSDKAVDPGLDYLRSKRINIHNDSTNIIAEREEYKYKQDRDGNTTETPVKANDHTWDAIRYGGYTHTKGSMPGIAVVK